MLGLLNDTSPQWAALAREHLDVLLADHAHCELKAAQSALSLLARFAGEAPELTAPLLALAQEEGAHFAQVEAEMQRRGLSLGLPATDDYAQALRAAARATASGEPLLDRLLVHALIEARSCERFRCLCDALPSGPLRDFYRDLLASEARHFALFYRLARGRFGHARTRTRFDVLRLAEADIAAGLGHSALVHG